MINLDKLRLVLESYKKNFITPDPENGNQTGWQKEKYKWIAVKHFQSNWDIDAPDFGAMFKEATAKTNNLLNSMNYFPRETIIKFAEVDQAATREMFRALFNEDSSVVDRVNAFINESEHIRLTYDDGNMKSHYQNVNSISTYLWLMYPDKYYIYKYSECREVSRELDSDFKVKKGAKPEILIGFIEFYNEIASYLSNDTDIKKLLKQSITDDCYDDPKFRTLTIDVGFYISRYYAQQEKANIDASKNVDRAWFVGTSDDFTDHTDTFIAEKRWENFWTNGKFYDEVNSVDIGDRIAIKSTYTKKNVPFNAGGKSIAVLGIKAIGIVTGNSHDGKKLTVNWNKINPKKEWYDSCVYRDTIHLVEAKDGTNQKALLNFVFNNDNQDYSVIESKYAKVNYWPSDDDYELNLTKDEWKKYIEDIELPSHKACMGMLKALVELGGEASCNKLVFTYGGNSSHYISIAENIGKRAKEYFDLPPCMDGELECYFAIPFLVRTIKENGGDHYSYKIREELFSALNEIDMSGIDPYVNNDGNEDCRYWWLNANPKIWSFSDVAVGSEQAYTLFNDNGHKRRIFKNFIDAKAGDIVIGYESTPVKQVVAIAKISKEQDGTELCFKKVEGLATPIDYHILKECAELKNMECFNQPQGSLFRLTKDEFDVVMDIIRDMNPIPAKPKEIERYSEDDFLQEVYMGNEQYRSLKSLLKNKLNLILQGAPGVGKTFAARRLAYSIMGEKDDSRIEFVQFHQNYSYEDFMMGYKPTDTGFELKYGIFYRFCMKAANHPDKEYFFIIDEINRGNMSKIFGELLMLIEKDYRGTKTTLAYNGMAFSVPENLYIIGMMNTADRSLAMIDYALRRRFGFFTIVPGFDSQGFKKYQKSLGNDKFDKLVDTVQKLNKTIANDKSLGSAFCIGHSYFCGHEKDENDSWIREIVEYDLIPMLNEYWFDDSDSITKWSELLRGIFNE